MTMHNRRWRLAPDAHGIPGQPAAIIPFPFPDYAQKAKRAARIRQQIGGNAGQLQAVFDGRQQTGG